MNKIAIYLALGASVLLATAAAAAPLNLNRSAVPDGDVQTVRVICDESGRCWRQRNEPRIVVRESYGYAAPRERYIERRAYEDRGGGVSINAPGVSVGIGTGRY